MSTLKEFISNLVDKYWKDIKQDVIGCGFSCSIRDDIKQKINKYLEENNLYTFNIDDFNNDTDEYVKYYAYIEIMKLLSNQIKRVEYTSMYPETPKRFEHHYDPRDE